MSINCVMGNKNTNLKILKEALNDIQKNIDKHNHAYALGVLEQAVKHYIMREKINGK